VEAYVWRVEEMKMDSRTEGSPVFLCLETRAAEWVLPGTERGRERVVGSLWWNREFLWSLSVNRDIFLMRRKSFPPRLSVNFPSALRVKCRLTAWI
jgi:hypothetical protein